MGSILPDMGITLETATGLAQALFSKVEQRVLGLLFGQPDRSFQGAELIRLARSGDGAVHRVLTRLAKSGLVTVTPIGNQKHYRANPKSPIFHELHGIIVKTVGLAAPLQAALAPFARTIEAAFVFGSMAKGTDSAKSDIDLMLIADELTYSDLFSALQSAEATLGRPVNPTIYSREELRTRRAGEDPFLQRVLSQPKVWLIGSEHALT